MRQSAGKKITNIKNKSVWPHIVWFILMLFICNIIFFLLAGSFIRFSISNKISQCDVEASNYVNYIVEEANGGKSFQEIMIELKDSEKRPLSVNIVDSKGEVIASYGSIRTPEDRVVPSLSYLSLMVIIPGFEEYYEKKATEGDIKIYLTSLFTDYLTESADALLSQNIMTEELDTEQLESMLSTKESMMSVAIPLFQRELFRYDFWKEDTISSDGTAVYIKQELVINVNDFSYILMPILLIYAITVIITIVQFIRAISSIHTHRSYLKMMLRDDVTGGYNNTAFEYFSMRDIPKARNKNTAYVVLDLSIVKYQNYCTLYGVEEGEKLLEVFDYILRKNLKKGELVARVAGGDFTILLKGKGSEKSENYMIERAKSLFNIIPKRMAMYSETKRSLCGIKNIRFRAGLYYLPPVTDSESKEKRKKKNLNINNLYMKAGIAKQTLGDETGLAVYTHKMWEEELWEQKVEAMMQSALDNQEFQVYIQPKYHPSTEELSGGEALVRWISPSEGFISPGQFIPIFERTGFVTKLDDYMISHTAALQAKWLAEGRKIVPISVNVSRAHFAQADLAEHIRDLVDEYPLPHKYIEIELTESAFFDDKKALLNTVEKLQEFGFEVSMDDFGSGYSSLNSLKDLPLNVLKLDAEFFRGEDFDGRGEIVVSEAISLAKQLNMRIVAEGVEKKEQVDFLANQECDMIQGFYFAKPMPADEYSEKIPVDTFEEPEVQEEEPEEVPEEPVLQEEQSEELLEQKQPIAR